MRDYSKVGPQFWNGTTGKALKAQGPEALIVALYLMTCQHANMLGLYFLSKGYIAIDTGLGIEGATKGLQGAIEAGFCHYDEASEVVWVVEMAAYQVGERLDPKDNQCKGVQRAYDALIDNPFLPAFFARYGEAFCMTAGRGESKPKARPSKAPPKPGTGTGERTGAETGDGAGAGTAPGQGASAAGAAATRGTRLPTDWVLPKAWGDWALEKYPHWTADTVRAIATNFKNYWTDKTGKDATKVSWKGTWENWCDNEITQGQHPPPKTLGAGAIAAQNQAAESRAKADRIKAALQAGGGAVVPAATLNNTVDMHP